MSLLRHIRRCNAADLSDHRPFLVADRVVGSVHDRLAHVLADADPLMQVTRAAVAFHPPEDDFESRSLAFAALMETLADAGAVFRPRDELFPVVERWGAVPLMAIDRRYVQPFGLPAFGVHVNGYVRRADGLALWVARRAEDVKVEPGRLDSMVGGGQPLGLTIRENMLKEAAEEAGLPESVAGQARPVGAVSYLMEVEDGLRRDTLFCYDLELDEATVPRNTDGELQGFEIWPIARVIETLETTDDFKFNVPLTLIDFLIRHGILTPEDPDYTALVHGLRRDVSVV